MIPRTEVIRLIFVAELMDQELVDPLPWTGEKLLAVFGGVDRHRAIAVRPAEVPPRFMGDPDLDWAEQLCRNRLSVLSDGDHRSRPLLSRDKRERLAARTVRLWT